MVINIREGTAEDGGFIIYNNVHITRRELEILALVGMGFSNEDTAKKLGVRVNTVRNHIWNIMQKIGAKNRAHAIVLAVQNGIIEIMHKRSLKTHVRGLDKYVLCILCGKTALADEYRDATTKRVIINHVDYEMPILPQCPHEGCKGDILETIDWYEIREHHPEYPEIPEYNTKYDFDIKWYSGYPDYLK
jgi:DNA-binding CsgD family transcriptional regulator